MGQMEMCSRCGEVMLFPRGHTCRAAGADPLASIHPDRPAPPPADTKPTNPKDAIGSSKLPMHLWPQTASALGSLALMDGALKYGRGNWRSAGVKASIYYDALMRHVTAWFEGEAADADSGLSHLGHALACLAILVDAEAAGKLVDDRQFPGGWSAARDALTPHVERLKRKHAERVPPRHFTIADKGEG